MNILIKQPEQMRIQIFYKNMSTDILGPTEIFRTYCKYTNVKMISHFSLLVDQLWNYFCNK